MSQMEFKGYVGTAELSQEDNVFHGKLAHIRDLVTYESATAKGLIKAFEDAVNDYLADCKADEREPDKPFKGLFNVRTSPDLHRAYATLAAARGQSLNEIVTDALETALPKLKRR
jgi:predicted HicB family RNase H-like nuclease